MLHAEDTPRDSLCVLQSHDSILDAGAVATGVEGKKCWAWLEAAAREEGPAVIVSLEGPGAVAVAMEEGGEAGQWLGRFQGP